MELTTVPQLTSIDAYYKHAAHLLITEKRTGEDTVEALVQQGLDNNTADEVVSNLQTQIAEAKKKQAQKDILYGALWCVGGLILTAADIGFIFWGAIVFGGIQFFKGLYNSMN